MKKIIFCFPYKGVGGVSLLFSRFAAYLHQHSYDVAVIDYVDGYMAKNLQKDIPLLEYCDGQKLVVPADSFLVLQTMTPWSIYPMLDISDSTQLYFLTTLPINLYPILPILRSLMSEPKLVTRLIWLTLLRSEYQKIRRFLLMATTEAAISFLDYDIVHNIEKNLKVEIKKPVIVPLFSDPKEENNYIKHKCYLKKNDHLVFSWIGRLADFKVHILNKLIDDAEHCARVLKQDIEIIIVGSGDHARQLKVAHLQRVKIKHIDNMPLKELDIFLLGVDALFAMGTSALEGAKLGVPTVRLDYSFKPIKGPYRYKWLYEINDFSMAQQIGSEYYSEVGHKFEDLVAMLKSAPKLLSEKTFEHYQKNHSIKEATQRLIEGIKNTGLTFQHMKRNSLLTSFLYSIWTKLRG